MGTYMIRLDTTIYFVRLHVAVILQFDLNFLVLDLVEVEAYLEFAV